MNFDDFQHPKRINSSFSLEIKRRYANFRQNIDRKNNHSWRWTIWLNWNSQRKNPRQIRYPPRSAKIDFRRKTIRRRQKLIRVQHPKRINSTFSLEIKRRYANFRQDIDRKNNHSWRWTIWLNWNSQRKNPRQIRYPPRSAKIDLRRKTIRRRQKLIRLQHPKRINSPFSLKIKRWYANFR